MDHTWLKAHRFEEDWWGDCTNTYLEEKKQIDYAEKMGLEFAYSARQYINLKGKSVLDIGGGVVSLLLKCENRGECAVIDPLHPPTWVQMRYQAAGIKYYEKQAENFTLNRIFDEVWIYNVLQHVSDPEKIIFNAKKSAKLIRIFEWIDTPPHDGHPITLREKQLNEWLEGVGKVYDYTEDLFVGYNTAYAGVFPTRFYGK